MSDKRCPQCQNELDPSKITDAGCCRYCSLSLWDKDQVHYLKAELESTRLKLSEATKRVEELNEIKTALLETRLSIYPLQIVADLKRCYEQSFQGGLNIHAWRVRAESVERSNAELRGLLDECGQAIAKAIYDDNGLDGSEGEKLGHRIGQILIGKKLEKPEVK